MGESATSAVRAKYRSVQNLIESATNDGERAAAEAAAERMRARYDGLDAQYDDVYVRDWFRGAAERGGEWRDRPRPSDDPSDYSFFFRGSNGEWVPFDDGGESSCRCQACQAEQRGERETVRTVNFNIDDLSVNLEVAYRDGKAVQVLGFNCVPRGE